MLQSEEEKPKKEKGVKKKSTEPKKLSINKKPGKTNLNLDNDTCICTLIAVVNPGV